MTWTEGRASMYAFRVHIPHHFTGPAAALGVERNGCRASATTEVVEYVEDDDASCRSLSRRGNIEMTFHLLP